MADRLLFISWGTPVHGMEERSLEVFNEALGLYGRLQQEGRIESMEVVLLAPNATLNGYIELRDRGAQRAAARAELVFRRDSGGTITGDHLKLLDCMSELVNSSVALEQKG